MSNKQTQVLLFRLPLSEDEKAYARDVADGPDLRDSQIVYVSPNSYQEKYITNYETAGDVLEGLSRFNRDAIRLFPLFLVVTLKNSGAVVDGLRAATEREIRMAGLGKNPFPPLRITWASAFVDNSYPEGVYSYAGSTIRIENGKVFWDKNNQLLTEIKVQAFAAGVKAARAAVIPLAEEDRDEEVEENEYDLLV